MDTRVLIEVTIYADDMPRGYVRHNEPRGRVIIDTVPCDNYGDLLEQLVNRAHDKYCAALDEEPEKVDET